MGSSPYTHRLHPPHPGQRLGLGAVRAEQSCAQLLPVCPLTPLDHVTLSAPPLNHVTRNAALAVDRGWPVMRASVPLTQAARHAERVVRDLAAWRTVGGVHHDSLAAAFDSAGAFLATDSAVQNDSSSRSRYRRVSIGSSNARLGVEHGNTPWTHEARLQARHTFTLRRNVGLYFDHGLRLIAVLATSACP